MKKISWPKAALGAAGIIAALTIALAAIPAASSTPPAGARSTVAVAATPDGHQLLLQRFAVTVRHDAWLDSLRAYKAKVARHRAAAPRALTGSRNASSPSGGASTSSVAGQYPPSSVRDLVVSIFTRIAGPGQVSMALCVANRESHFDPNARNPNSSAAGVFQWLASSWASYSTRYGFGGASVFNPVANITVAARAVADAGWGPWGGSC